MEIKKSIDSSGHVVNKKPIKTIVVQDDELEKPHRVGIKNFY